MKYFYQTLAMSEYKFCQMNDSKIAAKNAASFRFLIVDTMPWTEPYKNTWLTPDL